jgi:hypothetical protein
MKLVWSCPDCWTDLEDEGWNLYCPQCDRSVSWMEFAADLDPYDERHDYHKEVTLDADHR